MRKYGRWMLALGVLAVCPAVSNAQYVGQRVVAGSAAKTAASTNQQMAEQIAGALRKAQLRGYDVEIEFKNGVALLKGKVKDAGNKARATQAVQALRGVRQVNNQLVVLEGGNAPVQTATYEAQPGGNQVQQVAATAAPSNQQLANTLAGALSMAGLRDCDVEIRVQNGTAVLEGSVFTAEQRATAYQVASKVPGITSVQSSLAVKPVQQVSAQQQMPLPQVPPQMAPQVAQQVMQRGAVQQSAYQQVMGMGGPPPMTMSAPAPMQGMTGGAGMYGTPNLPDYAWPSYAQYPNSAAITYPTQYSASAWPYMGPYYPYPQVPLGWRKAQLEWDDGHWQLSFDKKTDKWWWFMMPKNW